MGGRSETFEIGRTLLPVGTGRNMVSLGHDRVTAYGGLPALMRDLLSALAITAVRRVWLARHSVAHPALEGGA